MLRWVVDVVRRDLRSGFQQLNRGLPSNLSPTARSVDRPGIPVAVSITVIVSDMACGPEFLKGYP